MKRSILPWNKGWFLLIVASPTFFTGCGNDTRKPEDADKILQVFMSISEMAQGDNREIFLAGALPTQEAELKRFHSFLFMPVQDAWPPRIKGDTATVKMEAILQGEKKGEVEWTFVKQGEFWKIKSAPMP